MHTKKTKLLIPILFIILFTLGCSKGDLPEEENLQTIDETKFVTVNMDEANRNFDALSEIILTHSNLKLNMGNFQLKIEGLKRAPGIKIENTHMLITPKNDFVIIDNNNSSIYVKKYESMGNGLHELYGFKEGQTRQKNEILQRDDYRPEKFVQAFGSGRNISEESNLYEKKENFYYESNSGFVIRKPMMSASLETDADKNRKSLSCATDMLEKNMSPKVGQSTRSFQTNNKPLWQINFYKETSNLSISAPLAQFYESWASLNRSSPVSIEFDTDNYYADIDIKTRTPTTAHENDSAQNLNKFWDEIKANYGQNGAPSKNEINVFITSNYWDYAWYMPWSYTVGRAKLGLKYYSGQPYGVCIVSTYDTGTLAHEVGHTLNAVHYDALTADYNVVPYPIGTLSLSNLVYSVMTTSGGLPYQTKPRFYSTNNITTVKNSLDE